jgi:hypothetical protein
VADVHVRELTGSHRQVCVAGKDDGR